MPAKVRAMTGNAPARPAARLVRAAAQGDCPFAIRGERRAFTLIELLVVIAVIGILAAMLLPALSRSKLKSQSTICVNNTRQLAIAWMTYAGDNGDQLVLNRKMSDPDGANAWVDSVAGDESWPSGATNIVPILKGLLFPYNPSLKIYQCPTATAGPVEYPTLRLVRNYSLSSRMGGGPPTVDILGTNYIQYTKLSQILNPGPGDAITFADESLESIDDGCFALTYLASLTVWRNTPTGRHQQGGNFAYADGHAEHWKWAALPDELYCDTAATPANALDFRRLSYAIFRP
jgi:prepilin-type N-terminal cleavage/methylation domain-containing protein/prepilin-type processing-associated H-X9-DG protein